MRWYLRFKLSFRDLVEMMAERGISLAYTTIMRWIARYVPEFEKRWNRFACRGRHILAGREIYVKIKGKWTYLYRAVDKQGKTVDFCSAPSGMLQPPKRFSGGRSRVRAGCQKDHARRLSGFASGGAGNPWRTSAREGELKFDPQDT